ALQLSVTKVEQVRDGGDRRELAFPTGLRLDARGNVVVADSGNGRLVLLSPQGQPLQTMGKEGSGDGELNLPMDVAVARDGTLYVADTMNHRVAIFARDGKFQRNIGAGLVN